MIRRGDLPKELRERVRDLVREREREVERAFRAYIRAAGLPEPVAEHRFHPSREWRFDWAWPAELVALEVEGGVWTGGRHTRGKGFLRDMEKYNAAAVRGWAVLRCVPDDLYSGATLALLREALIATSR